MKKLTDSEIISLLLPEIHQTANSLSIELNYNSPSSIYHIINGINNISEGFINRVIAKFPKVNYLFLKNGELPILLDEAKQSGQNNILNSGPKLEDIPIILKNIEKLLSSIDRKLDPKE